MRTLSLSALSRTAAIAIVIAGAVACAPPSSSPPTALGPQPVASASQAASTPVLLSCPVGQQPLMRQVVVQGSLVPQVECVAAAPMVPAGVAPAAPARRAGVPPADATPAYASPEPVRTVAAERPQARRVSSRDGVVEYRRPAKRSWQKSAVIIGSAAGAGAGVGALAKGKKGALIGAAIGGGAATVWDQVTRRQPR